MPAKVGDASASATLLFGEAEGAPTTERLRDLIASALLPFEIANAWLARRMSSELVTLDRRLVAAAGVTDRLA